ncbi:HPr kinase/phosphorylase [Pseudooceanicola sp.]|uniref:HPr kinase/phosphorylase n=1 Tax=Pseudooceanicola sp. TaxID=1914328 RepID=UPI004058C152
MSGAVSGARPEAEAPADGAPLCIHATAVAHAGRGLIILGASGSGKSALALELMARGAQLVADDRVDLRLREGAVIASAPATLRGRIEARFVGILHAETVDEAPITLAVDLDEPETQRLPPRRSKKLLGVMIPLLHNAGNPSFSAAILQYLKAGRSD